MQDINCDFIRIRESLAVMAIDDYTNRVIVDGNVNILMNGEHAPLEKEGGCHVFINLSPDIYNLSLGGWRFQQKDIPIDLTQGGYNGLLKVRLLPNENYIAESGNTIIQGTTGPGAKIRFLFPSGKKPYKLCHDYIEGEKKISLYHLDDTYLDSKLFCILREDGVHEEFYIEETLQSGKEYSINQSLNSNYKKAEAVIRRVYCVTADDKGRFFFLIPKEEEEKREYEFYLLEGEKQIQKRSFEKGQMNRWSGV